jgi:hypothetical protein
MTERADSKTANGHHHAAAMGTWSSFLSAGLAAAFAVLAVLFSPSEWKGMEDYAQRWDFLQMINMIPVILLTFSVVVTIACVHHLAPESKRVYGLVAVSFSSAYAAVICVNYYLQLFVVRLNIASGDLEGLPLLAMPNLHSVFFALETMGYAFLSAAMLFLIPIILDGKLGKWIAAFIIVSSTLGLFGAVVALFDRPMLIFAGLGIWSLTFPIAMALLGFYFLEWNHEKNPVALNPELRQKPRKARNSGPRPRR